MGNARLSWTAALLAGAASAGASAGSAFAGSSFSFAGGDVIVAVEGNGPQTPGADYGDNQAAPLTLYEFDHSGTSSASFTGMLELPQTATNTAGGTVTPGQNWNVSGEYGSSSEATLQLTGNGKYLTIMGYGIGATQFNSDPGAYGPVSTNAALAQSGSLTGQSYTPVPRVVAVIGQNGSVNSTTALYNVFDQNNPRSVYSETGTTFYVSGQGDYPDDTGGVFYTTLGSSSATSITGADAGSGNSQDTRTVQIYDNTLYVSTDSKKGATNRDFIGTLGPVGGPPPTTVANGGNGPTMLPGYGNSGGTGKVTITAATTNGVNAPGDVVNLSPSNFFFANADTLYVADTGSPKNTSAQSPSPPGSPLGDGGLQKWTFNTVTDKWVLDYTLAKGLDLVPNTDTSGSTGLYGLTGEVVDNKGVEEVELFATNYTIGDLDQTYLYGITDPLEATSNPGESFTLLATAPADANFKGVAFAPVPEPSTWAMLFVGVFGLGVFGARRATAVRAA